MKDHDCKNQESCLSQVTVRRDIQHQQRVIQIVKQLDDASKQSQEETKSLSEDTTLLRREIDESSMFPKSMAEWTTSEQCEEIRELKANNIALQGSVNTEKSLDPATLSPDPGESLVNHAANSGIAGHCTCFAGSPGI